MKRTNFYFSKIIFTAILLYISATLKSQVEQTENNRTRDKDLLDSLLNSEQLDSLPGKPMTYYSHGYSIRAKTIQQLVRDCVAFYTPLFPGKVFNEKIFLLNKSDWERLPFPQPYGLPHYTDINESLIVSADKNALSHLNNAQNETTSDSVVSGFDYVALHELGHYVFFTLYNIQKEHWFNEVMASYFLICYLQKENLPLDLVKTDPSFVPKYKRLEDFERLYARVGPQNYDWYQRKFIQLGYSLYPDLKTNLIKNVIENYSSNGKKLDAPVLFDSLAPQKMLEWRKGMQ
ncbi:MAG: hypothetical protein JST75_04565 [Bacteroidetes bacterium]|nr:hypothetical protein [Bacteroidota bacterium]